MTENNELVKFKSKDGIVTFDVTIYKDEVWLTQKQMTILFDTSKQNISLHINNIFEQRELEQSSTVKDFLTVQIEGTRRIKRKIEHYNLDVILHVGYRVKSKRGTEFRRWATKVLKDHLLTGYSLNTKKLLDLENHIKATDKLTNKRFQEIREALKYILKKIDPETSLY